jgi:hypothetical protein
MNEPTVEELRRQLDQANAETARLTEALQRAEWLQDYDAAGGES